MTNDYYDESVEESEHNVAYIDDLLERYIEGEFNIICAELENGEKVLCMHSINEEYTLYMPIHLIEDIEDDEFSYKLTYKMYSYRGLAADCSELILSNKPSIIFAPKPSLMARYTDYWTSIRQYHMDILVSVNESKSNSGDINTAIIEPTTLTKS